MTVACPACHATLVVALTVTQTADADDTTGATPVDPHDPVVWRDAQDAALLREARHDNGDI